MGCPVPKVCRTGAGAALLADPARAVAVARAAAEGSGLPVTVKLRSGWRAGERAGIELAHRLVDGGGRGRDRLASAPGRGRATAARPTTRSSRELVQTLAGAGDPERRPARRGRHPRSVRADRRRGGDAGARRASATRGCSRSCSGAARARRPRTEVLDELDWVIGARDRAPRRAPRRALPAPLLPVVRRRLGLPRADARVAAESPAGARPRRRDARYTAALAAGGRVAIPA